MHLTEEPFFTHPNLPKGKELVTSIIVISPHLTSPVGEGLVTLSCDYQLVINIRSNQHLPNGGEREGAEVHWQSSFDYCHQPHLTSPVGEGLVTLSC